LIISFKKLIIKSEKTEEQMNTHVCSARHAGALDNGIRRFFHNPKRFLSGLIQEGDAVLDIGCGPGTFTMGMAEMIGPTGRVVAADLQSEMLSKARAKAESHGLADRISFHKCQTDRINLQGKFSLILAFFMVHEVSDQDTFMSEVSDLLEPGGFFYLVEPLFHASKRLMDKELALAKKYGLSVVEKRNILFGKGFVLQKK